MRIQINITDTSKSISVEESCNLSELVDFMQTAFPENWKEFKVETKCVIHYSNPITIQPYWPYWINPWYGNTGTIPLNGTTTNTAKLIPGQYNVDFTNTISQGESKSFEL